jgi:hypothetical protein
MASKFQIPIAFKSDPRGIKEAESALSGFGKKLAGIGVAVAGAFAVNKIVDFTKASVNSASSLQESLNAVVVSYGAASAAIIKVGEDAAQRLGVTQTAFNQAAVRFSAFAERIVGKGGNVADFIDDITLRAADFASVFNIDVSEALQVFQSGLSGEAEPLKRFGINLLQSEVQAYALREGLIAVGEQMTEDQKIVARYGLLMESTAKTAGDFANTSDSLANSQRILQASFQTVQATIGMALLPTFEKLTKYILEEFVPPLTVFFEQKFPELLANIATTFASLQPAIEQVGAVIREAFDIGEEKSLLEGFLANIEKLGKNQTFLNFLEQVVVGFAEMLPDLILLVPLMLQLAQEGVPLLVQLLPPLVSLVNALATVFGATATAIKEATADTGDWVENTKNVAKLILESLPVVGSYVRIFNDVADSIRRAGDALRAFLTMGGKAPSLPDARFQARAVGGPVSAMDSYIVGERGPEIFTPGAGGFITPNNRLGGGSSTNITINVTAGMGANGNQIGEEIIRQIKRYERASGPVFASA